MRSSSDSLLEGFIPTPKTFRELGVSKAHNPNPPSGRKGEGMYKPNKIIPTIQPQNFLFFMALATTSLSAAIPKKTIIGLINMNLIPSTIFESLIVKDRKSMYALIRTYNNAAIWRQSIATGRRSFWIALKSYPQQHF